MSRLRSLPPHIKTIKNRLAILVALVLTLSANAHPAAGLPPEPGATGAQVPGVIRPRLYLPIFANNAPQSKVMGAEVYQINRSNGADQLASSGSYWVRRNGLLWSSVEPTYGARQWTNVITLEQELIYASQKGLQTILVVRGIPQWARKVRDSACSGINMVMLSVFAQFMRDAVTRYSVAPYNVKYWEIGNEPDVDPSILPGDSPFGCWGDSTDPYYGGPEYAQVLKSIYPQIKAVDPQAKVLTGGLLLNCDPRLPSACGSEYDADRPPKFLEGILIAGGAPYFDIVSFHAYDVYQGQLGRYKWAAFNSSWDTTGPLLIAKSRFVKDVLNRYKVTGKEIFVTEVGVVCGGWSQPPGSTGCEADWSSPYEMTKAYYMVQSYAAALAEGMKSAIWYSMLGWRNTNLLNTDLTPRPAFTALTFAHTQLASAYFVRQITEYPGLMGYEFQHNRHKVWVIWSLDGILHPVTLPSAPSSMRSTLGGIIPLDGTTLRAGLNPTYVIWNQ